MSADEQHRFNDECDAKLLEFETQDAALSVDDHAGRRDWCNKAYHWIASIPPNRDIGLLPWRFHLLLREQAIKLRGKPLNRITDPGTQNTQSSTRNNILDDLSWMAEWSARQVAEHQKRPPDPAQAATQLDAVTLPSVSNSGIPEWITRLFRSKQFTLLKALWGQTEVSAKELLNALDYRNSTDPAGTLNRRVSETNKNLFDRSDSIGEIWMIRGRTRDGIKSFFLDRNG